MIRKIPAAEEVICDSCGKTCSSADRRMSARLTFKQDALDYLGNACADGTVHFDLCDGCAMVLSMAINARISEIRAGKTDGRE